MKTSGITAHMIVKNEDQWVWYAINSVLPYVDTFLITDTGSTDQTVQIINTISSPKIKFNQIKVDTSLGITQVRSDHLSKTKTDWIWIVDGDEVYPTSTAKACLAATRSDSYEGIVVRRYDLLGDIYHRQNESVGSYHLFGQSGHLVTRLVNKKKIKGLHYQGAYPLEGWYDQEGRSTRDRDPAKWYLTTNYLYHSMYLKRSSLGGNLPMFNRGKYKVESGIKIEDSLPEVFSLPHPPQVPNPLFKRGPAYELTATVITPLKNIKRLLCG